MFNLVCHSFNFSQNYRSRVTSGRCSSPDGYVTTSTGSFKLHLLKENYRDSLPSDFLKICHMWKNEVSRLENDKLVCRATFAQPDTDYQYAIVYTVTDKGELKIIGIENESHDDSEG
ncbi:MAG TPA: hypothetical protein VEB86_02035, partial [Chryseosolibacter sp.]|nr:hypothetical protein [Chryseosolibacter sp.]